MHEHGQGETYELKGSHLNITKAQSDFQNQFQELFITINQILRQIQSVIDSKEFTFKFEFSRVSIFFS